MTVINYYRLSDEKLDYKIKEITKFIFSVKQDDPKYDTAIFALTVANCAKRLRSRPVDNFTQLVLDIFV